LRNGEIETETTTTLIPGIIKPDTAIIFGDEINRDNPYAVNSLLPVLSGREIVTDMGRTPMPNLLNGIFTMNPSERAQATFPLTSAFIGRLGVGAFIGASRLKSAHERASIIAPISVRGGSVDFESLKKLTSVDELKAMRQHVRSVVVPGNGATQDHFARTLIKMTDGLRDMRVADEADGRGAVQLARNARTLAALSGRTSVEAVDIYNGAKMLSTAKIAAQSRDAYTLIPRMHQDLGSV
jgi:MoxR-like ATPase